MIDDKVFEFMDWALQSAAKHRVSRKLITRTVGLAACAMVVLRDALVDPNLILTFIPFFYLLFAYEWPMPPKRVKETKLALAPSTT